MKEKNSFKFRAWDTHEDVMNRVDYIDFANGVVGLSNEDVKDYEQPIHRVKLMQSTGLRDKNGVEIYEGDVINAENDMWSEYQTDPIVEGGVVFESGAFVVSDKYSGEKFTFWVLEKIKVIGNVHENPELLEEVPNGTSFNEIGRAHV